MSLGTGRVGLSGASAGGGGGVTATLTRSDVTSSSALLTIVLSAGATLVSWSVQRSPKGINTWTTIATGLTDLEYEATGLDSSSDYDFQGIDVVSTTSTTTNVVAVATAETTIPYAATPWYAYWPGQETAFAAVNDGGIWFNADGSARAFEWITYNVTGRTADKIRVPLPNALAQASSARICAGVGGSGMDAASWSTPTAPLTIMAAGAGGEYQLGATVVEITLPGTVANNERVLIRVEAGAGVPWTGVSSWVGIADSSIITGPQMANPGQDITGSWSYSGLDLGMNCSGVQWHVTGDPIVRILVAGDSRDAGVPPVADPANASRRSWIAGLNVAEAANGQRFSVASWAEGGYTFTQYCDRIEYLLDNAPATLQAMCDVVAIDALSWNSFPTDATATTAIRSRLATLKTKCNNANLGFIVHCVTPPGEGRQTAGHLAQYADWQAWFAATPYAVFMAPGVADPVSPTNLDATKSADNVHVDSDYGTTFGAAFVDEWWTAIQAQGA